MHSLCLSLSLSLSLHIKHNLKKATKKPIALSWQTPIKVPTPMSPKRLFFSPFLPLLVSILLVPGLSDPNPEKVQPFLPNLSPSATIPAFPEQSNAAACPLDLPDELFHGVKSACGGGNEHLRRSRCCPVLAAWLYSAYSATALGTTGGLAPAAVDMPLLPDDSETCVDNLGKSLRERGIELVKPNETCDLVYCYCGIRLRPLSCPEAFSLTQNGKLVGDKSVKRLERDCLSSTTDVNGFPGLGGCSKCLNTLHLLNNKKSRNKKSRLNSSRSEDRTTKMHSKDCQLMGLTWLLAKNRTAYIHTVSVVLQAMMLRKNNSYDPLSCTLSSDGMPLAVDSYQISSNSPRSAHQAPVYAMNVALVCLLQMLLIVVPSAKLGGLLLL